MKEHHNTVSEVVVTASLGRRIFLFGSFRQFSIYFLFLMLTYLGASYFMGPEMPQALIVVTVIGAVAGTLPTLLTTLPARFSIKAKERAAEPWLRDLDSRLHWMGYRRAKGAGAIRYEHVFPWWLRWSENGFDIKCEDGQIEVAGPVTAARRLRREMIAKAPGS